MTTTRITPAGISALAALVHEIRPDWDRRGIAGAAHQVAGQVPFVALAIAFLRGAVDPDNDTPAAIQHLDNRAWESGWYPPCRTHPQTRARRPNGQCAACWTDRREDPDAGVIRDRGGKPIPDEARQLIAATVRATPDGATP